jgi:hypothetical protein
MNKLVSKGKTITFSAVMICFTVSAMFIMSELMLRMIPGYWSIKRSKNSIFRFDEDVGVWKKLGGEINSFGMFDKARRISKKKGTYRIAILGDSMMEGGHAGLGYRMSDLLEQKFDGKAEVLNFGISSVGTVQEYFIYLFKVRQFRPDLVVLAFLTTNDVRNNSRIIELSSGYKFLMNSPYCSKESDGDFEFNPPTRQTLEESISGSRRLKSFLSKHLATYRFFIPKIKNIIGYKSKVNNKTNAEDSVIENRKKCSFAQPWPCEYVGYRVYGPPIHDEWKKAWQITEYTILKLKTEVEKNGSKFLLVILTDAIQILPNPKDAVRKLTKIEPPHDFDVDYPNNRLVGFAIDNDIDYINLLPRFRQYAKIHKLREPYFSFKNDGHWSKLGHKVAADFIAPEIGQYMKSEQ